MPRGGGGDDVLIGGQGFDQMWGEDGNDALTGGQDADDLQGGAGDHGGAGDDTLTGGAQGDLLAGGTGADMFVLAALAGSGLALAARDQIQDFLSGTDVLDLSLIDANSGFGGDQGFTGLG